MAPTRSPLIYQYHAQSRKHPHNWTPAPHPLLLESPNPQPSSGPNTPTLGSSTVRIALVTETFAPEINGVAMTLDRLVEAMKARGHTFQLVRPRRGAIDKTGHRHQDQEELLVPGIPLPKYDGLHIGLPCPWRLARAWRAKRPDIVHIATQGPLGFSALRAASVLGLPVSSSFHTNFHVYSQYYGCGIFSRLSLDVLKRFHNRTGCTMVPTAQTARELTAYGFKNTCVLARGVDTQLFTPNRRSQDLRASWGLAPDQPAVFYAGRLALEKNINLAIQAFRSLSKTQSPARPAAKMILIGDGPIRKQLEAKNPDLTFVGYRRGQDLAAHYASCDVMLFPSLTETFGNVVTEAMASGVVTIAFDTAAAHEHIISPQNGITVPTDRPDLFIKAAADTLANPDAWPAIRAAARQSAQGVSWDLVYNQFESHLSRVLQEATAKNPAQKPDLVSA
jgi:glycosyltransferase involved in cell wall biosynthesis